MQAGKPIAFASNSLSDCETRYAKIEREILAVVFGASDSTRTSRDAVHDRIRPYAVRDDHIEE